MNTTQPATRIIARIGLTPEKVRAFVESRHLGPTNPPAPVVEKPKPRWIPLKEWIAAEANRLNINPHTLYSRVLRRSTPCPRIRRVNKRVVLVEVKP